MRPIKRKRELKAYGLYKNEQRGLGGGLRQ